MKQGYNIFQRLFFLFAALHLLAVLLEWQPVIYFSKPLLMPTLAGWYYLRRKHLFRSFDRLIIAGLLFSMAGDTFLMFVDQQPDLFLFGLASFLVTHLLYIFAFIKYEDLKKGSVMRRPWLAIPVMLYLAGMIVYLWEDLPEAFRIPVVVYSSVISLMLLCALNMSGRVARESFLKLIAGASLFVLSDSVIAIEKFKAPEAIHSLVFSLVIMSTYIAGQYLIALGCAETDGGRNMGVS